MSSVGSLFNCYNAQGYFWETPGDKIAFKSIKLGYDFVEARCNSDEVMDHLGDFSDLDKIVNYADRIDQQVRTYESLNPALKSDIRVVGAGLRDIAHKINNCVQALESRKKQIAGKKPSNCITKFFKDRELTKIATEIRSLSNFSRQIDTRGKKFFFVENLLESSPALALGS